MRKLLVFLLAFCLIIASCGGGGEESSGDALSQISDEASNTPPVSQESSSEEESSLEESSEVVEELVYIALGDSIARGYGLAAPLTECYPAVLFETLGDDYTFINYGVDGHKTSDLLTLLETAERLEDADIITISIGSNNVLGHAIAAMSGVFAVYGMDVLSEYARILGGGEGDAERVEAFIRALEEAFVAQSFVDSAEAGIADFEAQLPQIIQKIRSVNADCTIVLSTIYNPYLGFELSVTTNYSFLFGDLCQTLADRLNDYIFDKQEGLGYLIADVAAAFASSDSRVVNAGLNEATAVFDIDPHPNALGHQLIASVFAETLK